ncbi:unnamed protein product, partial [marine sediment metagenome]
MSEVSRASGDRTEAEEDEDAAMNQWERKPHWSRDWLEQELVVKRRTLADIGRQCGVSREAVRQHASRFGLRKSLLWEMIDEEWLRRGIVEERRTMEELAIEIGISYWAIRQARRMYGIKIPRVKDLSAEEQRQRMNERQNHRYATDPECRRKKIACARRWQRNNPERYKEYHRRYQRERYADPERRERKKGEFRP